MNPLYDHYLFECLAALVKNVCIANPPAVADFEKFLFPSFEVRFHDSHKQRSAPQQITAPPSSLITRSHQRFTCARRTF